MAERKNRPEWVPGMEPVPGAGPDATKQAQGETQMLAVRHLAFQTDRDPAGVVELIRAALTSPATASLVLENKRLNESVQARDPL